MIRRLVAAVALALASCTPNLSFAQALPLLPRTTTTTGLNDSALFMVSDSARRTRAATGAVLKSFFVPAVVDSATGAARAQKLTTARVLAITGDLSWSSGAFDGTAAVSAAGTLATVNSNVGSFGSSTSIPTFTVNGKGLITAASGNAVVAPAGTLSGATLASGVTASSLTGFGVGARTDSATGSARSQTLTTARTLWGQSFDGSAAITGAPTFGAGATVSSGQTLTLTGATITGLTAASVGTGTFPSGTYSFTGATALTGGAGNMTLTAGTGNSRTLTLQTTTSAGTAKNTLVLGADTSATFLGKILASSGAAGAPSISFTAATNMGLYKAGSQLALQVGGSTVASFGSTITSFPSPTVQIQVPAGDSAGPGLAVSTATDGMYVTPGGRLAFAVGGTRALDFSGGAALTMQGGAGSMTIIAGTGNSRTLTLKSSNSSGTATTFATSGGDTLKLPGHAIFSGLTAEPSTQSDLCIDATTFQVYINAASNCTVSAQRFKENIGTVSPKMAWDIIRRVPVDSFAYRNGGKRAFGTIADSLAIVDERLVTRNPDGQVNSANYEQLTVLLLGVVKDQQRRIDSLVTALAKPGRGSLDSLAFNSQVETTHANIAVTVAPDGTVVYAPGTTLESLKPVFRALALPTPKKP